MMLASRWISLVDFVRRECVYGSVTAARRHGSSWNKRAARREELENNVFQFAGKNVQRSDRIYAWGCTATGALGLKSLVKPTKHQRPRLRELTPHRLDFFTTNQIKVKDVECGYGFTLYLCETKENKTVLYGTGINTNSQLGYHEYPRNSGRILDYVVEPTKISLPLLWPQSTKLTHISCGRAHAIIATDNEGVFTLGNNSFGQCGRTIVQDEEYRGSRMIGQFQVDGEIKQICCGQDHTQILTTDGRVYSCGLSNSGQTGLSVKDSVGSLSLVEGEIKNEKIIQISSKADSVLAVSEEGGLFGWGNAEQGQLGEGDVMEVRSPLNIPFKGVGRVIKAAIGHSMSPLLNDRGEVFTWGRGILGKGPKLEYSPTPQLLPQILFGCSDFDPVRKVKDIQAGLYCMTAINASGHLFVWGKNTEACLGLGNRQDQYFPFKVNVPAEVCKVSCGADHMVVRCKSFF